MVPWMRGHVYLLTGRWNEAIASYERAVGLRPEDVVFLYEPARVYLMLRDYANAERYYDRILELQSDHVSSQVAKAWLPLWRDGDVGAARAVATQPPYRHAGDLFYVPPEYFGWLAAFYERDYAAALRYLDVWADEAWHTAADYIPKSSLYGVTYALLGEHERADRYFRMARTHVEAELRRNPGLTELWIALGETLAWLGDSDGALSAAGKALDMAAASNALSRSMVELIATLRVFVPVGEKDAAFDGLEAYLSEPGNWSIEGLQPDPRIDPIRDDPRFLLLLNKYRRR
jgi:tetratricopeptide (TPR) repeat protein